MNIREKKKDGLSQSLNMSFSNHSYKSFQESLFITLHFEVYVFSLEYGQIQSLVPVPHTRIQHTKVLCSFLANAQIY